MSTPSATQTARDPLLTAIDGLTKTVGEIDKRTTRIEDALAGDDLSEGFITATKHRLDNHASRIRRMEWAYALAIGGFGVVVWLLDRVPAWATAAAQRAVGH